MSQQQHQISSYGVAFTKAIRSSNLLQVRTFLFEAGLNPNACNKFGESVIHLVCRQRNHEMLGLLLEAGCSVQVCDDFGRTPLHDACWTSSPNFKLISMLLDHDPWLLCLQDCRGSTPLGYVKDDSHYRLWIEYLDQVADKYWPCIPDDVSAVSSDGPSDCPLLDKLPRVNCRTPPLVLVEPNSRPIVTTELLSSLEVIERVANGLLQPGEVKKVEGDDHQASLTRFQFEKSPGTRRISLDPMRTKGALSATSLVSVPGFPPLWWCPNGRN
jgi:ankyrin repeat protein